MITVVCPKCKECVQMPEVLVRRNGIVRCNNSNCSVGAMSYPVSKYYDRDGSLRKNVEENTIVVGTIFSQKG